MNLFSFMCEKEVDDELYKICYYNEIYLLPIMKDKAFILLIALNLLLLGVIANDKILPVFAAPPATEYDLGETLEPNCSPGDANCSVVAPARSGVNNDITDLTAINSDITLPSSTTTRLGIGGDPTEAIQVDDGNILLTSDAERGMTFRWENPAEDNPVFQLGRMVIGGVPGAAVSRFIHRDDVTPEHSVFEVEDTGTVASVRAVGSPGSHFEGFFAGESEPLFRLNSFPSMQLELGAGGASATDVILRREASDADTTTPAWNIQTNGAERVRINDNGIYTTSGQGIGADTNVLDLSLNIGGGMSFVDANTAEINITADDTNIVPGDRSLLRLLSDNATPANRTFTIDSPATFGQMLILHWNDTDAGELIDGGDMYLSGDWTPGQDDTITLLSTYTGGTHKWVELSRSDN